MNKDILLSVRYAILFTIIMLLINEINWGQFFEQLSFYYILKTLFFFVLSGGLCYLVVRGQRKKKKIEEDN
ncbi:MAG: hypothetical protein U9O95_06280 [Candidatus Marinimicrobia bacterium]|nr:hypothetical protein [Candidatus Neomarinimicrobiota bacterium]